MWKTFVRGTRAAAAVEDGIVRMWDVVWNSDEGRFDEAAMRDSVRAHQVHVSNQISVSVLPNSLLLDLAHCGVLQGQAHKLGTFAHAQSQCVGHLLILGHGADIHVWLGEDKVIKRDRSKGASRYDVRIGAVKGFMEKRT